jgi:hypothetical protein
VQDRVGARSSMQLLLDQHVEGKLLLLKREEDAFAWRADRLESDRLPARDGGLVDHLDELDQALAARGNGWKHHEVCSLFLFDGNEGYQKIALVAWRRRHGANLLLGFRCRRRGKTLICQICHTRVENTIGRVVVAGGVEQERLKTGGRVIDALGVVRERLETDSHVVGADSITARYLRSCPRFSQARLFSSDFRLLLTTATAPEPFTASLRMKP